MRIRFVDIDGIIPNLALMKLCALHRARGDVVGFGLSNPDITYIAVVFQENYWKAIAERNASEGGIVVIGGTGYDLTTTLNPETESLPPDYTLYNGLVCPSCGSLTRACKCKQKASGDLWYGMGFTTRGCVRQCGFCVVPEKEGMIRKAHHPSLFRNPHSTFIRIMDNNFFALKGWFFDVTKWLIENNMSVSVDGLDARLLNLDIALRLVKMRWWKPMHFAFDSCDQETAVRNAVSHLKVAGITRLKQSVSFYVLVGYDTTPEEDKYRCRLLKELGVSPFVMPYVRTKWTRKLARWANSPWIVWSCDIDDYMMDDIPEGQQTLSQPI